MKEEEDEDEDTDEERARSTRGELPGVNLESTCTALPRQK